MELIEQRKDTTKKLVKQTGLLLKEARKLIDNGFWIVPTIGKISKSKNDKNTRLSYSDFEQIVIDKNCNGLGILTNKHTNYLSFDLDTKDATNPQLFERRLLFELDNYPNLKSKIKLSKSPSGGYHLYILVENHSNKKPFIGAFAWSEYHKDEKQKQTVTGRSIGQYCCEFPTINYQWIIDNDLETLTAKDKSDLKTVFSVLNEDKDRQQRNAKEIEKRLKLALERKQTVSYSNVDNIEVAVWDDFNNKNSVHQILENNGFDFRFTKGSKDYYLRNGSKSKTSGFIENGLYVNFSDNAGLPTKKDGGNGRKFSAFDLTVFWSYGGDYSGCSKDLITKGYGQFKQNDNYKNTSITARKTVTINNYSLIENQYIGNVLSPQKFKKGLNYLIGGTGTGKTNFTAKSFKKTIVVSRNITTLENFEQYGFNRFLMSNSKDNFSDLGNGLKITVTFASLKKLLKQIDISDYVIVFDEFHLLVDSYKDVRNETQFSYNILNELQKDNIVILASANDVFISDSRLKIQSKHIFKKPSVKRTVNISHYANFNNLKEVILKRLKQGKKVLLYTNRTENKTISKLIKKAFKQKSILFFDATKHNDSNIDLTELEHDLTICTKALTTGKDINSSDVAVIIYCDDYDMKRSTINQFFGRTRHYKTASFDLLFTFKSDNKKWNEYNVNTMFYSCNQIAKCVIDVSVNDIAFLHENDKYFVSKVNNKMAINHFAIDNYIEKQISCYTVRNTQILESFLLSHGYNCEFISLVDLPVEKLDDSEKGLTDAEKYINEVEIIHNGNDIDYDFETTAKARIEALQNIGFSKNESLLYSLRNDSTLKWNRFVRTLICEVRLTTDKAFLRDYNNVLNSLNDNYYNVFEIVETFQKQRKTKTMLGREIGLIKTLKNDSKTQRTALKVLRKYYELLDSNIDNKRVFKLLKVDNLTFEQKKAINEKDFKKLLKLSKII